jgi:hypothetical protein
MTSLQPLWQIEEELAALVDSVDTCPSGLLPELMGRIAEYIGHEVEKVDRINGVLTSFEQVAANAQAEIVRLRQRQQAAQRAADRLSDYVLRLLQQREGKPLKGRNVTFSIRKSEGVVIVDPQLVPERFRRTTITVDHPKDAIRRAIKEGQEVAGVVLEQRENLARK